MQCSSTHSKDSGLATHIMKYFAYGSNLLLKKMREVVPSAVPCSVARLSGYRLKFHKKSIDGSAKCDAFRTGDEQDVVHLVVYEIDEKEKPNLDRAEGLGCGYNEVEIEVKGDGGPVTAFMYVADSEYIDNTLQPYTWYKQYVLEGARQHGLPESYIEGNVTQVKAMEDPDTERDREKRYLLVSSEKRFQS